MASRRTARARLGELAIRAARVPPWAWLSLLVVTSALLRFQLSRDSPAPWILVDELIYSELAKSIAAGGDLLVRDVPVGGYGVVYPLLISPAWAFFDQVPDAYAAAKAINAVLISLAAVPAYLLARRVVGQGLSLLAAVLAVALPSLAYSGVIMTENAFYPLFLVTALSLVLVLERPTLTRQLVLVGLLGVGFLTRPQALGLAAAALTAPLVQGLLRGSVRAAVAAQRTLYALAGLALVVVRRVPVRARTVALVLARRLCARRRGRLRSRRRRALLPLPRGRARPVSRRCARRGGRAARRRRRNTEPRLDAFLAATIAVSFWMLLLVAAFASRFAERVQERNVFYLVPLVLIALLAWVERGAPRPRARDRGRGARRRGAPGCPALSAPDRLSGARGHADAVAALEARRLGADRRRALVSGRCWRQSQPPRSSSSCR